MAQATQAVNKDPGTDCLFKFKAVNLPELSCCLDNKLAER